MNYHARCLLCGGHLIPAVGSAATAPWRCPVCFVAFWAGELTPEARSAWRKHHRDFGPSNTDSARVVRSAVKAEMEAAAARGVSLRPDQLGLVDKATLAGLARAFPVAAGFLEKVQGAS